MANNGFIELAAGVDAHLEHRTRLDAQGACRARIVNRANALDLARQLSR